MSRWSVFTVRVLVVVAFALILLFQVLVVPSIIAQSAGMYPMFAYLQVPAIIGSVMLLACGQVVLEQDSGRADPLHSGSQPQNLLRMPTLFLKS